VASLVTQYAPRAKTAPATTPVVIVGAGPVGIKTAQELHRRQADLPIVVYGDEPSEPYNRVRLSGFLSGELKWQALTRDLTMPQAGHLEARLGLAVVAIDRERRVVRDAGGYVQPYSQLVIATGSRPHVPAIPGTSLPGVYTFRDARDVQKLIARRVRSRRTVVLGGGLLGLEAARAMQRFNTEVRIVEHYTRLMMRQLDEAGAQYLLEHVQRLGIGVILGDSVVRMLGAEGVSGIALRSGNTLECDTIIVATGIQPNIELARTAGLHVGRGIRVNDRMQTSDPLIYAVGECAEHRDRVYGIVAPGLEQAAVAAHVLSGGDSAYRGSTVASRLKVVALPTFSMGLVVEEEVPDLARLHVHRTKHTYRKLVTMRGRLLGAIAVGECPEMSRLQEAVLAKRHLWPWQILRFRMTGRLYSEQELTSVVHWPAAATVCNCTGVTRGALGAALASGCSTVEALAACTGASSVCGSCRPLLAELAGTGPAAPERGWKWLLGTSGVALPAALALALILLIPYAATVQVPWQWDVLWRDSVWKQTSGFTVLALSALLLVLSLRKRMRRFTVGNFPIWRVAHAALGALTLAGLAAHTGGRLGSNLNFALIASFLGVVAVGSAAGGVIALEHRLGAAALRLRRTWTWAHILLFWPIPILLALHVFKTYYF
jgi:nitrite reductase (NADH) large subunit